MGSVLPHLPQRGGGVVLYCELQSQDDRDVPAQPGTDQWKSRQRRAEEIYATSSVHITALEKGKDIISCEGGAEGEGEGEEGGEFTSSSASARIGSNCKHGDEEDEVCPIGTPVNLPATVWYE